ncbi:MAG: hypothetical protein KA054_00385 [Candidatus Moranbacteria bacterium]|nr:hypothetical protein [Candidatus Moranbacteria bacterium]
MAKKKPETLFRDAVLKLMDNRSAPDFRTAFMMVAHKRGIFHRINQETYNSWFGRVLPLVTRAIRARKLKEQRAMRPPKKASPKKEFARLYHQGHLSGFTPELAEFD